MATPQPTTSIVSSPSPDEALAVYIRRPEIMEKFTLVMKDAQARRFVQNVIVLVETAEPGDWSLQNCSPRSIVRAALRAATQRVSVDPAEREAYLVPRLVKRKVAGVEKKVLEACFSFHYQEIENRAWRTGLYTHINVSPIYAGTEILVDLFTGLHAIKLDNGTEVNRQSASVLASWGKSDGLRRIGWLGYYRTRHGREKTIYMTIEEIEAQVSSGNPNWKSSFMWTKHREIGERKTTLLALLRMADLKAPEMIAVKEALETIDDAESIDGEWADEEKTVDEKIIDGAVQDIRAEAVEEKKTEAQNLSDLGFEEPAPKPTATAPASAPTYKYSDSKIVAAVAQAWDEAPNKVAVTLHAMHTAGEIQTEMTINFAKGIQRPATTIEDIPA